MVLLPCYTPYLYIDTHVHGWTSEDNYFVQKKVKSRGQHFDKMVKTHFFVFLTLQLTAKLGDQKFVHRHFCHFRWTLLHVHLSDFWTTTRVCPKNETLSVLLSEYFSDVENACQAIRMLFF